MENWDLEPKGKLVQRLFLPLSDPTLKSKWYMICVSLRFFICEEKCIIRA